MMNVLSVSGVLFVALVVLLAVIVHKANASGGDGVIGYAGIFIIVLCAAIIDLVVLTIALLRVHK